MNKEPTSPAKVFKTIILSAVIVLVLLFIAFVSAGAIAKSRSISQTEAQKSALADAKVSMRDAHFEKTNFTFRSSKFVYEIAFYTDNGRYEYLISAKTGEILQKNADITSPPAYTMEEMAREPDNTQTSLPDDTSMYVGLERAKDIALKDAKLNAFKVTFLKAELTSDGDTSFYEVVFSTADTECSYKIDALSGDVLSREAKPRR